MVVFNSGVRACYAAPRSVGRRGPTMFCHTSSAMIPIGRANSNDANAQGVTIQAHCLQMLGKHCPLLEICDLGHQVWDDRFTEADVTALLRGCPNLAELNSQNGFQLWSISSPLLKALKSGPYTVCVEIGFRNPRRDMKSIIGSFVEDSGEFEGCLTTFPYCYNNPEEMLTDDDKRRIAEEFDKASDVLMEKAAEAGFDLNIDPMDWFD